MSTVTLNSSSTLIKVLPRLLPAVLPLLVLIILLFFAINAPGFLSWGNLSSLVLKQFRAAGDRRRRHDLGRRCGWH